MLKVKKIGALWHVITSSGVSMFSSMVRKNCTDFIQDNFPNEAKA
jgi:hypothetical protein